MGEDGRTWLNEASAARGEPQLAELRFEIEGMGRLLEASKTERDFLVRRYEVGQTPPVLPPSQHQPPLYCRPHTTSLHCTDVL